MVYPTMVDLETLGLDTDSQVLSIGACTFDKDGRILSNFYEVIELGTAPLNSFNHTPSTVEFWENETEEAKSAIWDHPEKVSMHKALTRLSEWLHPETGMWANGTKFDLAKVEYEYKKVGIPVPFKYNSDRCMRTLRKFAGKIDIHYEGIKHHALHDSIWQAKYTAAACKKLNLKLLGEM